MFLALLVVFVSAFGSVAGVGGAQSVAAYFAQKSAEQNPSGPRAVTRAHRAAELPFGLGDPTPALPASDAPFPSAAYASVVGVGFGYPAPSIGFARIRDGLTRAPPHA